LKVASPFPDGELDDAAEIGAVDSRSVRVWVRKPGATTVSARLDVEGRPAVTVETSLSAETDWTGAITLALPDAAPESPFVCTVGTARRHGRLAPLPEAHAGLAFGFGSCHRPYTLRNGQIVPNAAAGIYAAIARDLRRADAAFMLLGGDQVYSDELQPISIRDNLPGDEQHPPPFEVALDAYRRVSRGFLGQAGIRALREAFPTYCMWDDHEIFNNWGSRLEKTPLDLCLFRAASRAYCEYQHRRNPGGTIGPPPYHYTFRYGDVGFLALDVRGARDYEHGTLLGATQWQAVQSYLSGDDAATVQTLFVIVSVPIAHVARWMAELFDDLPGENGNQVRDRWCSARFVQSRDALLDALFAWEAASPVRQVILLSGDVHAASAFTIRQRNGRGVIQQLTSSALSTPHTPGQRILNWLTVRGSNLFERRYRFRRRLLVFPNNYGLVRVAPLASGGHRVEAAFRIWQPRQQRLVTAARLVSMPRRGTTP
jgi:phosphodiesterase/alkaline phosphatase D-like protein